MCYPPNAAFCGTAFKTLQTEVSISMESAEMWSRPQFLMRNRLFIKFAQIQILKLCEHPSPLLAYAMKNLPEDNGVDQWRVTPYSPSKVFSDNTAEYMMRYHPFKPKVLENAVELFRKIPRLCQARRNCCNPSQHATYRRQFEAPATGILRGVSVGSKKSRH